MRISALLILYHGSPLVRADSAEPSGRPLRSHLPNLNGLLSDLYESRKSDP